MTEVTEPLLHGVALEPQSTGAQPTAETVCVCYVCREAMKRDRHCWDTAARNLRDFNRSFLGGAVKFVVTVIAAFLVGYFAMKSEVSSLSSQIDALHGSVANLNDIVNGRNGQPGLKDEVAQTVETLGRIDVPGVAGNVTFLKQQIAIATANVTTLDANVQNATHQLTQVEAELNRANVTARVTALEADAIAFEVGEAFANAIVPDDKEFHTVGSLPFMLPRSALVTISGSAIGRAETSTAAAVVFLVYPDDATPSIYYPNNSNPTVSNVTDVCAVDVVNTAANYALFSSVTSCLPAGMHIASAAQASAAAGTLCEHLILHVTVHPGRC